jgi:hypothetical protein
MQKNYFATREKHIDSSYHSIVTDGNEHMKNGNVCIGCHSHKKNKHNLNVCSTNIDNEMQETNCVSCHMPKVKGSVSTINKTLSHSFHGFAGAHSNSHMLQKYVDITMDKDKDNFSITINNKTTHALLLHPLRIALLKVNVVRGKYTQKFKDEIFQRVIGHNGKPAMPWKASTTLRDTMIQGKEKRNVIYKYKLQKGDKINVILGWYLVNPNAIKSLGLEDDKVATTFIEFKKESFIF